jgi:hypothetical protein
MLIDWIQILPGPVSVVLNSLTNSRPWKARSPRQEGRNEKESATMAIARIPVWAWHVPFSSATARGGVADPLNIQGNGLLEAQHAVGVDEDLLSRLQILLQDGPTRHQKRPLAVAERLKDDAQICGSGGWVVGYTWYRSSALQAAYLYDKVNAGAAEATHAVGGVEARADVGHVPAKTDGCAQKRVAHRNDPAAGAGLHVDRDDDAGVVRRHGHVPVMG